MDISESAIQAKREYARQWREKNRERIRQKKREWDKAHPEKLREYQRKYWEKKAAALMENLQ